MDRKEKIRVARIFEKFNKQELDGTIIFRFNVDDLTERQHGELKRVLKKYEIKIQKDTSEDFDYKIKLRNFSVE